MATPEAPRAPSSPSASQGPSRVAAAVALVALLALVPWSATANHPQSGSNGTSVTFDHDGDNEWWVEVLTKASPGDMVVAMEVRAESSSTFRGLQNKATTTDGWVKWGPETAFRIPTGDRVLFRAHSLSDATGEVATIDSCWFTHPAGVEQCDATPSPPPPWPTTVVGDAGRPRAGGGDLALGDADNDGRRDVTIGTFGAGILTFEHDGSAWVRQRVGTALDVSALAVGDGDGDGLREVYSIENGTLLQSRFTGGAWSQRAVLTFAEDIAGDMTLGDIDGLPGREIYVGIGRTECPPDIPVCFTDTYVYHVRFASGVWTSERIFASGGHIQSMWIGDGDDDGDAELYVGRSSRHAEGKVQLERIGGVWHANELPGWVGTGSYLVVGDVDRDGRTEVYTASYTGDVSMIWYDPATGNWTHQVLLTLPNHGSGDVADSLSIGDADNDGKQDLYIGTGAGEVLQVRYEGSQWIPALRSRPFDQARQAYGDGTMIVVGDGDGDTRSEVYAGILFGWASGDLGTTLYRIGFPAVTAFDATFTGVRGNEWWIQASVTATGGTVAKVDVRLNGGAWQPLAKQSWGGYAASYRAVQGTVVQFRATSTTGAMDVSDCYRWIPAPNTDATKVTCGGPPPAFDATFTGVKGNEWWVQATVSGNQPIGKVEARVNCGTWVALTYEGWGWAKSFHVPNGAKVEFRATSTSGAVDLSGGYTWPSATPTTGC